MLLGVKWQIAKLVRKDGVCSSTLAEQQEKRDDCRGKQNIQITEKWVNAVKAWTRLHLVSKYSNYKRKKSKNEIRIWLFCNRDERWESCDSRWLTEVVTLCYHIFLSLINKDVIVHHDVSLKTSSHAIPADINSNPIFRCKICKSLNLQPRLTRAQATLFTPAVRLL